MTIVYLVGNGTGTWVPPSTVTAKIEVWGAGAAGTGGGDGGGSGAYAAKNAQSLVSGVGQAFSLGAPGLTSGQAGGNTWFSSNTTVFAPGGGTGGTPIGDTVRYGAVGGVASGASNAGGAGAGGPDGVGSIGGQGNSGYYSGASGGGANGGAAGATSITTTAGAAGGNNNLGSGGGAGGTAGSINGVAGTNGGGGIEPPVRAVGSLHTFEDQGDQSSHSIGARITYGPVLRAHRRGEIQVTKVVEEVLIRAFEPDATDVKGQRANQ